MTTSPDVVKLATELIRIPSVNPMGRATSPEIAGESRVTDWLQEFFAKNNIPWRRYTVRKDQGEHGTLHRENILARFDGSPSLAEGGQLVMLEVHQDTVPIDGMTIEPFGGQVVDGRLTGRGACDIKGGMACLLTAALRLQQTSASRPTIVIACTVNEEFGFCGAKHLTELIMSGGDEIIPRPPDAIIVTEPTQLNVVTCHKGMIRWVCETIGRACHSSDPTAGANAIYRMAPVVASLEHLAAELDQRQGHDQMGKSTLSVGTIHGGVSINTVPDNCRIEIDRRLLPQEDQEAARNEVIQATAAHDFVQHHDVTISSPGLLGGNNESLATALAQVASQHLPDRTLTGAAYGTDAAFLASTGAPTVVFGPGSIEQAHTKDEWVDIEQLELTTKTLVAFLGDFRR